MNGQDNTQGRHMRALLATIAVLLGIIALELTDRAPSVLPVASAQIPDTAKQRQEIIIEAKRTNQLLEEILAHLKKGPLPVKFEEKEQQGVRRSGQ